MARWSEVPRSDKIIAICLGAVIIIPAILIVVGGFWIGSYNDQRLATEPHVPGTVLAIRDRNRNATRVLIEFTREQAGASILCRAEVFLSDKDVHLSDKVISVGQTVSVVPRPDSCGQPAVATLKP